MLASYCLLTFSGWITNESLVYQCGWAMIAIILLIMAVNMGVILFTTIKSAIRFLSLRLRRRRNGILLR